MGRKQGIHLPKFQGGNKSDFLVKRQLLNVMRQCCERLDNLADAKALKSEVERAFVYGIIKKKDYLELIGAIDKVLTEFEKE